MTYLLKWLAYGLAVSAMIKIIASTWRAIRTEASPRDPATRERVAECGAIGLAIYHAARFPVPFGTQPAKDMNHDR